MKIYSYTPTQNPIRRMLRSLQPKRVNDPINPTIPSHKPSREENATGGAAHSCQSRHFSASDSGGISTHAAQPYPMAQTCPTP